MRRSYKCAFKSATEWISEELLKVLAIIEYSLRRP